MSSRNYTYQHIEQFFLGQFEVYYSKLNWDLEKAREEAYQNTLKYYDGILIWKVALEQFKTIYDEK